MEVPATAAPQPRRGSGGGSSPLASTTASAASATLSSSPSVSASASASAFAGPSTTLLPATSATKQEPPQVDAWIVQKLKNEWSSSEFGGLLSKDKLSDAVTSFRHLDTAIKVRFLLSFLSMRREVVDESKFAIVEIIDAAENDSEEWVKVGAGIVKQYMFMSEDGTESGDSFFHEQIAKTTARVLDAVHAPPSTGSVDDAFSHESAFLNASVRPQARAPPTQHFTVVETAGAASAHRTGAHDDKSSERKPAPHRPQLPRPALHAASSTSSASSSSANAPTRLTPTTAKPPPPPRKHMTELSEIRRKADAGRFKRHRSRISMIDIDEVKQIESEKALKAEERKKQKVVAAAKDKSASAGGAGSAADKSGGGVAGGAGEAAGGDDDAHDDASQPAPRSTGGDDDEDDDEDAHDDDEDDHDAATNGRAEHQQQQQHMGGASSHDDDRNEYIGDGTQALLNAAIMTEVVGHQPQQHHHHHALHSQAPLQQQQQHAYHYEHEAPVAQPTTHFHHRGFEPEDAGAHLPFGFGGFGSAWGDQSYVPPPQQPPHPQYQPLPQLQQFSGGFLDDQSVPHGGSRQQSTSGTSGFDSTGSHAGGSYLDGPPDYWR